MRFLGLKTQNLLLLAFVELSEVLFLCLVNNGANAGNEFTNNLDLGELGCHTVCHFRDRELIQL